MPEQKSTRTRKTAALTLKNLERWQSLLDLHGFEALTQKKGRYVDDRFLTIAPCFTAIISRLFEPLNWHQGEAAPQPRRAQALAVARRSIGTAPAYPTFFNNQNHVLTVCDWMCRCILPAHLDRLPASAPESALASKLRARPPLHSFQQILETTSELYQALARVDAFVKARATAAERVLVRPTLWRIERTMLVLVQAMPWATAFAKEPIGNAAGDGEHAMWVCAMAIDIANHDDAAALSQLIGALLAIEPGDSQHSAASRCTWGAPARSARKSA